MKKPRGIDDSQLYVLDTDNNEQYEVDGWEEAKTKIIEVTEEGECECVIVKVVARVDYEPANASVIAP